MELLLLAYCVASLPLTIYFARRFKNPIHYLTAFFLSLYFTAIALASMAAFIIFIIVCCPFLLKEILRNYRTRKNLSPLPFPVASPFNRNDIKKPFKTTLFSLFIIALAFAGCKKNPCIYNNCDPEPKKSDCYISKKVVRQTPYEGLIVFDVDTSYYLPADVKLISYYDLSDRNAGVVNLEPYEACDPLYNYATLQSGKDTIVKVNGIKYYCVYLPVHKNPVGDYIGDSVLMGVDSTKFHYLKDARFMYN